MITRKNAIEFGTAVVAGEAVIPADTDTAPMFQPGPFAEDVGGRLGWECPSLGVDGHTFLAPEEYAEFCQYEHEVAVILQGNGKVPFDHPIHKLSEAAMGWANQMFAVGCRHGAALESFRREIVGPIAQCPTCSGYGWLDAGGRWAASDRPRDRVCSLCNGTGTVPVGVLELTTKGTKTD